MNAFEYANPKTIEEAVKLLADTWGQTEVMAGGTDLVTSLKQNLVHPKRIVSLRNVEGLDRISTAGDHLEVGAMTRLRAFIANADVQKHFPALVTAARNIGSPQIINMGTVGGDLLQRPRCWYFRQGFGLLATFEGKPLVPSGDNRYHAIFANEGPAYFVNPSSLAPGLIALDASVTLQGPSGSRTVKVAEFFTVPKSENEREYVIKPNEILTKVSIPLKGLKNGTYEIRQRRGLDWPMVAASVAFSLDGANIANAKVVLGHVAPTPWVAQKAAAALNGKAANEAAATEAGKAATDGAKPLSRNGYKIPQVQVAVKRAILSAVA